MGHRHGEADNPGPLSIVSANTTSLLLHFQHFLHHDLLLLQETRLTAFGQHYLEQRLNEHGWSAIWSEPRPPQRQTTEADNLTGKCGGVAILYRHPLQLQLAPPTLLLPYPMLQSHRFIHGILSTETGPTIHFISLYGFTGADVHVELQQHNELLLSSAFEYAASFGNSPVYIGMDANTTNISSPSLSQAYLSQRWYDIGAHFPYLKNEKRQSTCYAKGTELGRRIDYIYANSQAVNAIQDFYLDLTIPIPTHRPLTITVDIPLFSAQITRLSLPPTCYSFPKPSSHFLDISLRLFQWDIHIFNGNVEEAYDCWTLWAQQYFTLLTNIDFHSRGKTPCLRKGLVALPTNKELPAAYRPYTVLFNQTVSAVSELSTNPTCPRTRRFTKFLATIQSSAESLLPDFHTHGSPSEWLITLREQLINHRMNEQADIQRQRRVAWRSWTQDTWALNSKKIYQLVKGKFVEPFTWQILTLHLLQQAGNPIFAKYNDGENKARDYRTSFYPTDSPHLPYNFSEPTLEDIQYVISKKLKKDTATGLDGWRPEPPSELRATRFIRNGPLTLQGCERHAKRWGPHPKRCPRKSCPFHLVLIMCTLKGKFQRVVFERCPERCPNDARSDGSRPAKSTWPKPPTVRLTSKAPHTKHCPPALVPRYPPCFCAPRCPCSASQAPYTACEKKS